MFLSIVLLLIIFVVSLSYVVSIYNESYWKKRNAPYHGGKNMIYDFWHFIIGNRPLFEVLDDIYHKYDAPAVGHASMFSPSLFIRDPTNVTYVLSESFKSFHDRAVETNNADKLTDSVLFQNGIRWKLTRQKMTPLFTASKIKSMHYIMDKSAQDFVEYLNTNKPSDKFDALSLFCCAALSASVFGVAGEKSTFDSPFLAMARKSAAPSKITNMKFALNSIAPGLFRLLGIKIFGEFEKPFIAAIKQIIREREKTGVKMHDFADLAVNIQKGGTIKDSETGYEIEPTDELLAAQGFFFLIAGVDPSASAMFFTLFNLAKHPDYQRRVQDEIDTLYAKHNGKVDYDVVSEMEYLDMVLDESMRVFPPVGALGRKCTEDIVLPVGNIKVAKGTQITVPVYALHNDPRYYPNPEVYDPERFSKEQKSKRSNAPFMPFGNGNRICIGARFARVQIKTGLIHILKNFNVKTNDGHKKVEFVKLPLFLRPKNVTFSLEPRK